MAAAPPDPAAVKRGKDKFVSTCGFCHGNDGTGSRASTRALPLLMHDTNGETIGPVIRNGMPTDAAFPFTDAQLSDIAAFLHAQSLIALHSNRVPGDYPVEKLLTGNAAAGKSYFEGAGGCAKCHLGHRRLRYHRAPLPHHAAEPHPLPLRCQADRHHHPPQRARSRPLSPETNSPSLFTTPTAGITRTPSRTSRPTSTIRSKSTAPC